MVKLTIEMITKAGPGQKRRADESIHHYFNRLTHIYCQDKQISEVEINQISKALTVIYLYDNNLTKIDNFEFAPNLTHLYLQNNRIKRLANLTNLISLEKLHIGGNKISVVEGLENLSNLEELHIENQNLPLGEKLIFEPRTLQALSNKLTVLNIASNSLDTLSEIGSLNKLQTLIASNNLLDDMKEVGLLLACWPRLAKLDLSGNLICMKNKYRERLIVLAPNLLMLDGKEIQETSRQFLQNWKTSKEVSYQRNKQELLESQFEQNQHSQHAFQADSLKLRSGGKEQNYQDVGELPRLNKINQLPTYVMPEKDITEEETNSEKTNPETNDVGTGVASKLIVDSLKRVKCAQISIEVWPDKNKVAKDHRKKQMTLPNQTKQKKELKRQLEMNRFDPFSKTNLISQNMSGSLSSINPSTIKNNGFGHRFSNLSGKNKFFNAHGTNHYMEELTRMNHFARNQHASSASSFINMNNLGSNKNFNRSNLELNSAEKN